MDTRTGNSATGNEARTAGEISVLDRPGRALGINGLGRIGKLMLWHHAGRKNFDMIVVNQGRGVGQSMQSVVETIEKDSTYGLLHRFLYGYRADRLIEIKDERKGMLLVDGIPVVVLREQRNPKDIPWREFGVEVVAECTGAFNDPTVPPDTPKGSIRGHLVAGVRKVINSAPFKIKDKSLKMPEDAVSLIYGINHTSFDPEKHNVISAASCTTTALAHMVLPLIEHFQTRAIMTASMSTVHAATNSQSVLDSVPKAGEKDLRKNRSIMNNIILTSTGAAQALERVMPEIREIGFMADSVRIPIPTESLIILNVTFQSKLRVDGSQTITAETINGLYREASLGKQRGLLKFTMEQNVSQDLVGDPAAVVIEGVETHTRTGFVTVDLKDIPGLHEQMIGSLKDTELKIPVTHAKIFGWYDNEYGSYTNRLADLCEYVQKAL